MTYQPHLVLSLLAISVSFVAAICDLRTRRIPNQLIAIGLGGVLVCVVALHASDGLSSLGSALLRCLLGLLFCSIWPVLLYATNGMGGGDVKLFAFGGACLGPVVGLEAQLYAFVFGLVYAVGYLIYQRSLLRALQLSLIALSNPLLPRDRRRVVELRATSLPFAPAIGLGIALASVVRGLS